MQAGRNFCAAVSCRISQTSCSARSCSGSVWPGRRQTWKSPRQLPRRTMHARGGCSRLRVHCSRRCADSSTHLTKACAARSAVRHRAQRVCQQENDSAPPHAWGQQTSSCSRMPGPVLRAVADETVRKRTEPQWQSGSQVASTTIASVTTHMLGCSAAHKMQPAALSPYAHPVWTCQRACHQPATRIA